MGVRRDRSHRTHRDHRTQARPRAPPGPRLEPEAVGYCRSALETLQEGLSPEELALFTPNVLGQLQALGPEVVSRDFWGSQLLLELLPTTPPQLLAQLLPSLILGGLEGASGHSLGARVVEAALGRVGEVLGGTGEGLGEAQGQLGEGREGLGGTGGELGGTGKGLGKAKRQLGKAKRQLGKAKRQLGALGEDEGELGETGRQLGETGGELGGTGEELGGTGKGLGKAKRQLGKAKRQLGALGEDEGELGETGRQLGETGGELGGTGKGLGGTGRQLEGTGRQLRKAKRKLGGQEEAEGELGETGRQLGEAEEEVGGTGRQLGKVKRQLGEAEGELGKAKRQLGGTGRQLGKAKRQLGETGQELGGTGEELGGIGEELGGTGEELGGIGEELGAALGDTGKQLGAALCQLVALVGRALVAFAQHPPGSFVLRALLRLLGGTRGAGPELLQLAEAFQKHFPALLSPPCASLCLQEALQVLHHSQSEACSRLCQALIGHLAPLSPDPSHSSLLAGLQDPERSRLLEAAMKWVGPEQLRDLFQQLKGHLLGVANHRVANHGLQRLLDHAPEDVVQEVLSELGPVLQEPLARGHPGVLTALAGACRRHPALQPQALRCLLQAFGCWEPPKRRQSCVGLLIGLQPWEGGDQPEGEEPVAPAEITLQGSLLLQHLLRFEAPQVVLGSFQALPPGQLLRLAQSPAGSHLWEALLSCPQLRPSARSSLLGRLKGHFLSLACHRNGSRVLEAAWGWASGPTRACIAQELAANQEALLSTPQGRGLARSLTLDHFLRRRGGCDRLQGATCRPRP